MAGGVTLEVHTGQPTEAQIDEWTQYLASSVRSGLFGDLSFGKTPEPWRRLMTQWWITNPFVSESTAAAFVLRHENDVVGFHGLIPIDYRRNGERVPSLLATTFVVDLEHRGHSMKIFRNVSKLAATHQIVDGSATPDMRKLLDATGWSWSRVGPQMTVAVKPQGVVARLRWFALVGSRRARLATSGTAPAGARWISAPAEIGTRSDRVDDVVRPPNDERFLEWILSNGETDRLFTGLVDVDGRLLAHAILSCKSADLGTLVLRAVDGGSDDGAVTLTDLLMAAAADPVAAGLPRSASAIVWSEMDTAGPSSDPPGDDDRRVYYRLPTALDGCSRVLHPTESDEIYF